MLKIENLNQYYGGSHILRGLSFTVEPGKVTSLLGRNGVGKTTLMKCLMGLVKSKSGSINKSYGIDITLQRLKHLHKENDIVIHDLFDEDGKACGTKVTITMKTID